MASSNRVLLVGNLGRTPVLRTTGEGRYVSTVSLATTDRRRNSRTGEISDHTEWHTLAFFDRQAENAAANFRKGLQLCVTGSLFTHRWTMRNGTKRSAVCVKVETAFPVSECTLPTQRGESTPPPEHPRQQAAPAARPTTTRSEYEKTKG